MAHFRVLRITDVHPEGPDSVVASFEWQQQPTEVGRLVEPTMGLHTHVAKALFRLNEKKKWTLVQFRREGGELKPGELLSVYPPFCTKESGRGISLRAISASDRIGFLADFANQISHLSEGTRVRIKTSK